jgi:hypothetical protein
MVSPASMPEPQHSVTHGGARDPKAQRSATRNFAWWLSVFASREVPFTELKIDRIPVATSLNDLFWSVLSHFFAY